MHGGGNGAACSLRLGRRPTRSYWALVCFRWGATGGIVSLFRLENSILRRLGVLLSEQYDLCPSESSLFKRLGA